MVAPPLHRPCPHILALTFLPSHSCPHILALTLLSRFVQYTQLPAPCLHRGQRDVSASFVSEREVFREHHAEHNTRDKSSQPRRSCHPLSGAVPRRARLLDHLYCTAQYRPRSEA